MAKSRWEYRVAEVPSLYTKASKACLEILNALGQEGWELVYLENRPLAGGHTGVFKRKRCAGNSNLGYPSSLEPCENK